MRVIKILENERHSTETRKRRGAIAVDYCVPVMAMLTLNVESAPTLDDAVRANVAEVDTPAASVEDVDDQVIVRYVAAFAGLQLFTVIVRFSACFLCF